MQRTLGLVALVAGAAAAAAAPPGPNTTRKALLQGATERTYLVHVPPKLPAGKPAPLVFVFHGGGSDGSAAERLTKFSARADQEGFLVVYPDGMLGNFNDGREPVVSAAHRENVDDVGFATAILDAVNEEHPVDPKRVYATGISNGG